MKIRYAVVTALFFAMAALGADVSGKWTAEMQGRDGQTMTSTYTFKADGNTLTGTVGGRMGEAAISNGKIDGDAISFDVVREFNGNSVRLHYTGTVAGDSLTMKVEGGRGRGREITAKRL